MDNIENPFEYQIKKGERFEFGKNWKDFLNILNDKRIRNAEKSLTEMLQCNNLNGKKFIDVGCGSGLFSLAAMNLGAEVLSLDFDPNSVACTKILKDKFYPTKSWKIYRGSVLDKNYIASLGKFDVVYSWGVLHHTGNMMQAFENINTLVADNGLLFIAIYNDKGWQSRYWLKVKKIYNINLLSKACILSIFIPYYVFSYFAADVLKLKIPTRRYSEYKKNRGMSIIHDWYDWLGGLPFEVASVEKIFHFYHQRGYILTNLKTTTTLGNNEFVFKKT